MNVLQLEGISWKRNQSDILKNVSWTVQKGEHWAMVGANGSGKSTILNIIAGYIWPTLGQVTLLGHPFGTCDLREIRKSIGWVTSALAGTFQESRPHETAHDVVLSGRFASVGIFDDVNLETIDEADWLLEQFHVEALRNQPFVTLSQGEKQRILLARAWMAHPKLLILDEPCTGLDVLAREQLLSSLSNLANAKDAPTILYVTHHVEEILPLFTHVLLLSHGQVVAAGDKKQVLTSGGLTEALGVPMEVTWENHRPWVRIATS